jgi:hypothetical protein
MEHTDAPTYVYAYIHTIKGNCMCFSYVRMWPSY